ncbi:MULTISPECIES: succinate dehydrogenase, hydrophobic membrane anchor protein [unclassified Oleiphilus]|jgi:succinate dehydrogenase / fumarate reductase membrane anchor subunit|uniref:succinate dehydrogenase, hydrophobic membrane anchor protein n=2 Tax=Oleiphilus TaxID=141450 RepID=UPI0007C2A8DD|nr:MULTISPECIES: succinate dehydrogenase, hydrophobic membrane anchor protein [unclassified Oleiphilus]KZY44581.1 succinate dehydrogenase [Oleiphilus sp. HI0050]KZY77266.1 succinate dehydrogenase [Oleiphilus sp. HI0068]KZY85660.1 succinate dehydrogenase [Oleiphilus sp. HI0069]KZY88357.1 succinate dehydrogenase [Oleiphilus sp. HI0072]KZZ07983.1 succinate dehydrogenase [Oleiphilus sp. HI0078]KZZ19304.1 succinate dehydrogenase [Oleiphilus sp. HI0081]KZZ31722.1 succinate dehydrogenase [Oleiphilu
MVASVTSFGRSGLYDWMIQRVTAVVLAAYTVFILGYLVLNPDLTYMQWSELFSQTCVRVFSLLALLSLGAHAWIGLWTVSTDYLKAMVFRFIFQAGCGLVMFVYVVWGVQILWGL